MITRRNVDTRFTFLYGQKRTSLFSGCVRDCAKIEDVSLAKKGFVVDIVLYDTGARAEPHGPKIIFVVFRLSDKTQCIFSMMWA